MTDSNDDELPKEDIQEVAQQQLAAEQNGGSDDACHTGKRDPALLPHPPSLLLPLLSASSQAAICIPVGTKKHRRSVREGERRRRRRRYKQRTAAG